jgi:rare lipoprotein A
MRQLFSVVLVLVSTSAFAAKSEAPLPGPAKAPKVIKMWEGMASWYGDQWKGRKTACGQRFDPEALTAAHPSLPCGTWLRVTNVRTGQWEFAKVTDRGPYEEGREIDVTERVAKKIGIRHYGVEMVKLEVVRPAN